MIVDGQVIHRKSAFIKNGLGFHCWTISNCWQIHLDKIDLSCGRVLFSFLELLAGGVRPVGVVFVWFPEIVFVFCGRVFVAEARIALIFPWHVKFQVELIREYGSVYPRLDRLMIILFAVSEVEAIHFLSVQLCGEEIARCILPAIMWLNSGKWSDVLPHNIAVNLGQPTSCVLALSLAFCTFSLRQRRQDVSNLTVTNIKCCQKIFLADFDPLAIYRKKVYSGLLPLGLLGRG